MYNTLKNWADNNSPLTRDQELQIIADYRNDSQQLAEIMIRYNARYIIKEINRWRYTYDIDDAASLVITAIIEKFETWDRKTSFIYFIKYIIKTALHKALKNYQIIQEDLDDPTNSAYCEDYCDTCEVLKDKLKDILNDKEYKFIYDIYFDNKTVKDAGDIYGLRSDPSKSRKHREILNKIEKHLDKNDW
jgi:DNA-directed RNA polymerase specialized sigma subunit